VQTHSCSVVALDGHINRRRQRSTCCNIITIPLDFSKIEAAAGTFETHEFLHSTPTRWARLARRKKRWLTAPTSKGWNWPRGSHHDVHARPPASDLMGEPHRRPCSGSVTRSAAVKRTCLGIVGKPPSNGTHGPPEVVVIAPRC